MKKVIIIAVLALNAVCMSYLAFSESSQVFDINSAIAEQGNGYETSFFEEGSENVTTFSNDPNCGDCENTAVSNFKKLVCSGTGNVNCNPVNWFCSCYTVVCEGGDDCDEDEASYSTCPCTLQEQ